MAETTLLDIKGVETYYGNIKALNGVDVHVNQGEIVALIGANGAGKSTLMMTIFGAPRPVPAPSLSPAPTSPRCRRTRSRACASPSAAVRCRAASSRCCRSDAR